MDQASQSLHLAPGPAEHIPAHHPLEQTEQRPLGPARIGSGQIDRRAPSFGLLGQPLVARQCLRAPFRDFARLVLNPGGRHPHRLGAECAGQLSVAMPVAVAPGLVVAAAVTQAAEKLGQFFFEHGLDRRADIRPQTVFDRIIPAASGSSENDELSVVCFIA